MVPTTLTASQFTALDANHDGQLSGTETSTLKLWRDLNENGLLDSGELGGVSSAIKEADYTFSTQGNGLVGTAAAAEIANTTLTQITQPSHLSAPTSTLSVNVSNPRPTKRPRDGRAPPVKLAARSASVSYKKDLGAEDLRIALITATYPQHFRPHVRAFLDKAPGSLIADVVEQLHHETSVNRVEVLQHMRDMARGAHTARDIWL